MSEGLNDPALLFTPVKATATNSLSSLSALSPPPESPTPAAEPLVARTGIKGNASCFVELPRIPNQEKEKYELLDIADSESDSDSDEIVELVGEYKLGDKLYIYAEHGDGIIRRKEEWEFKASFPDLYEVYLERKAQGTLPPFDPSAPNVYPKHRIGLVLSLAGNPHNRGIDYIEESDEMSESSEEDNDGDGDYGGKGSRSKRRKRSIRVKNRSSRNLPFSPIKTRNRAGARGAVVDSVEDSDESDNDHVPSRRSRRALSRRNYADNEDSDFEMLETSDEGSLTRKKKKKLIKKRKGPKPAYGCIRDVTDLYDSDPETAPLRAHRKICERCRRQPTHILLKGKKRSRKRTSDDLSEDEEDHSTLGGWVRCLKCSVAAHWSCLAKAQRDEIIKAARAKADSELQDGDEPTERFMTLDADQSTEFVCGSCAKGGNCMCCKKVALVPEKVDTDLEGKDEANSELAVKTLEPLRETLFRCFTCKRIAHYSCLSIKDDDNLEPAEVAAVFQEDNDWQCADCVSYIFPIDNIIAWRPSPSDAVDAYASSKSIPDIKENLPRDYLVKWVGRSYRRAEWVPHMWLATTHAAKLKNFYTAGPKIPLLDAPIEEGQPSRAIEDSTANPIFSAEASRDASVEAESSSRSEDGPPAALPDALLRIPPLWKTVDRVLDILLWSPEKSKGKQRKSKDEVEDSEGEDLTPEAANALWEAYEFGSEPPTEFTETTEEFEKRMGRKVGLEDINRVVWAFIKWDDLPYDEATWDSPPRSRTPGYSAFEKAFEKYLFSRSVQVRKLTGKEVEKLESRDNRKKWSSDYLGVTEGGKYDIGQKDGLSLMPFQVDGVNWLCRNWFHHQQCILADEMGLGKTVQIITFLGILEASLKVFPALVVVPNSTITNWVREFERWAPRLRVVPFYGEQKSREIVKNYELSHSHPEAGTTGAKYHVLVTTYETITGPKDFSTVFKKTPRWEVLIVDEGQRLKSDTNLIFKRLNELNSCHRIIMTGTPLNNNIRELFNLLNFLDPDDWTDLEGLTKEFEVLTEDLIKDLHERLRPYFLRRVKAEVLDLPPKNEVIVPLSMAPLQKEIYKSILSKNLAVLRSLTETASSRLNKSVINKSNLRNMLMQLRKCLQHPYLISNDIEPKNLSPEDAHSKLISASGKLRFLKLLLPKLKERGHRVLLFSQFVIGLNIIEDFLQGEGYKFLRLDGDIKQAERQKGMDEFNREGSDVFIYILSTRAGGVGINLWSADTVIIYDPDFNPHQDLQAIARAHRFGQKKTCLVFKFMTKDSAEERIIQTGKKKLVLDHLIVQKINDDDDNNDVQSMLTFGAKALFDETNDENRDINYTEQDVQRLIEKTELEGDKVEASDASNNAFAFAKVWSSHRDALDDMPDEVSDAVQDDSWAQTLAKIQEEQQHEQAQEKSGRGVRRKAAQLKTSYFDEVSPDKLTSKGKKRRRSADSDDSDGEFRLQQRHESISDDEDEGMDIELSDVNQSSRGDVGNSSTNRQTDAKVTEDASIPTTARSIRPLSPIHNVLKDEECALCFTVHGKDGCFMTQKSENLVEYRRMLFENSDDEAYEDRVDAIRIIDETLMKRGHSHLIAGQPLKPVRKHRKMSDSLGLGGEKAYGIAQGYKTTARKTTARKMPHTAGKPLEGEGARGHISSSRPSTSSLRQFVPYDINKAKASNAHSSTTAAVSSSSAYANGSCVICGLDSFHIPAHCPLVRQGPKSVARVLARLTSEGGHSETIESLRYILRKQKKALANAQFAQPRPHAAPS